MSAAADKRLSSRPYRQAIERVQIQIDLIRFSLQSLAKKDQKDFFKKVANEKIAGIERFRIRAKQHKFFPDDEVDRMANEQIKRIKSQARRESRSGNLYAISEFTEDKLNQSELLLLVAHFESFMRLVHKTFLRAAPGKVFGVSLRDEQNPRIPLKEIFDATQPTWDSGKFLSEQIAKEVKWLDAQNIEKKAEYFSKHFGVSFATANELEDLKAIMKRRNEISHEIYEQPKTGDEVIEETLGKGKEPPLVSDPMLKKARELFRAIPRACVEHGGKTYQSYFKRY